MDKNAIADKIEESLASLPDDLKAVGKLNELIAKLRADDGEVVARGGGNGNGPPTGP